MNTAAATTAMTTMTRMKHFLSIMDCSADQIADILRLAADIKSNSGAYRHALDGKTLGMIFQKPSTRTRISFEVGMAKLGGTALYLSSNDMQLGRGETITDTAKVLGRYLDCIMARVFDHADLEGLTAGGVPVINGLSDRLHPCQALADVLTIHEHKGRIEGVAMCYLGDGNNVCHSLINIAARTRMKLRIATPPSFEPDTAIVAAAIAAGAVIEVGNDPQAAVTGVDVVYTDVWASMGQESEAVDRAEIFAPFQVNEALFGMAAKGAIFLHCLPAHRGEEVTDEVVDHERSVVFDQAGNRMHTEMAVLLTLLGND